MNVWPAGPDDDVAGLLAAHGMERVARRGEVVDALAHPALMCAGGVLVYVIDGASCEVLALYASVRFAGAGTALLDALRALARQAGCTRLWLVTTNDNVDALRFYQRRGFRLAALRPGAVDAARALKPSIPRVGDHGIALRDELELELDL